MKFQRIGIIHLNQIGDLLFSLPLLRALRDNFPQAEIHSIVRPHLAELLATSTDVSQLIPRQRGFINTLRLLKKVRQNRYDLLITLANSGGAGFLTALSKAKVKAGFASFPWGWFLDIKEKIEGHHSWLNNLKLLKRLEIEIKKNDYVGLLILPPADKSKELPAGKYAVISPGTSRRRTVKAWSEEKFSELIIRLKETHQLNAVLVGGKENCQSNERIRQLVKEKGGQESLDLTGKTSVLDLAYLVKGASLFVGVDSGIMHLAAAFDIPVVGLFGPSDPAYVGPQNPRSIVIQKKDIPCVPCYLKGCKDRPCMEKIEVSEVLEACERLLSESKPITS